ncbi:MAG: hypothetical protein MZV63_50380 [Marinilabiliales bacterium]|nr:hypothetical protein [Marinilabiliales bacterium]
MHAVFLYHAIKAGLDMGIVNAGNASGLCPRFRPDLLHLYRGCRPEPEEGCN